MINEQAMSRNENINARASRQERETVLLDQLYFSLPDDDFNRFTAMLDRPRKDNPKLRRLLETKPRGSDERRAPNMRPAHPLA